MNERVARELIRAFQHSNRPKSQKNRVAISCLTRFHRIPSSSDSFFRSPSSGVLFFTPSLVLRLALSKMTSYYLYLNISA